jgi:hypothetical protein
VKKVTSGTNLGNEVTTLLNQSHQLPHVRTPVVQHAVPVLGRLERHEPCGSVDLGIDGLGDYEAGEELFRLGRGEVEQFGETGDGDAGVVL